MSKHARKKPLAVMLGRAIQMARRINELSQADLAEKLDLSVNFIARVERGETFMSVNNLFSAPRSAGHCLRDSGLRKSDGFATDGACGGCKRIRVVSRHHDHNVEYHRCA